MRKSSRLRGEKPLAIEIDKENNIELLGDDVKVRTRNKEKKRERERKREEGVEVKAESKRSSSAVNGIEGART